MRHRTGFACLATFCLLGCHQGVRADAAAGDYVDHLIGVLHYAPDDDDREDAAEDLGKVGDLRALPALEHAAIYDEEDDVRRDARRAIRRIHRLNPPVVEVVATQPTTQPVRVVQRVYVPSPRVTVVEPAPVYVVRRPVYVTPVVRHRVVVRRHYYTSPVVVRHRVIAY